MLPPVVAAYSNVDVINSFLLTYQVDEAEAHSIFNELKKWLWISATAKLERAQGLTTPPKGLSIVSTLAVIDEMWHTFLLFTADYAHFCHTCLGTFVHHRPDSKSRVPGNSDDLAAQVSYIYDKLGEDTVRLWYVSYGETYSADRLRLLRR